MNLRSLPLVGTPTHEVGGWLETLARVGFAAKGVLYMTIGLLAASAAVGSGGQPDADSHSALQKVFSVPFGRVLVAVIALGLLGYSVWRIIEGIADPQRRGHDAKAIAVRASYIVRGLVHLALAGAAGALALYRENGGSHGERVERWTGKAMGWPGGIYLLYGIAGGLFAYGVYQLYNAYRAKLSRQLQLGRASSGARRAIIAISRFGIGARGLVFATIGVLLYRAARDDDPREAGGVGDSLRELFSLGAWPFLVIALGLGAYGIYELINAKYRRIEVP
jgi:hypothetical protein